MPRASITAIHRGCIWTTARPLKNGSKTLRKWPNIFVETGPPLVLRSTPAQGNAVRASRICRSFCASIQPGPSTFFDNLKLRAKATCPADAARGERRATRHKRSRVGINRCKTHRVLRLQRENKHCKCSASARSPRAIFNPFAPLSVISFRDATTRVVVSRSR